MTEPAGFILAIGSAAWLGILTSISPCPLATNVAAVAFVSREGATPRRALSAGLLYTLGRSLAYIALAAIAVFALSRLLAVSGFLQGTLYKLLGPVLIIIGMIVLNLIPVKLPAGSLSPSEDSVRRGGLWGAAGLGALFAFSFCPVSAALFFGMLIPLAVRHDSVLMLPGVYGIATGIPVAIFATTLALGAHRIGAMFNVVGRVERWARPATGGVLIVVGIYETLRSVFNVL
ncbi:MAG: sulfite exporter TauE/SafE family protein [Acidobacteria bacterium]|nr:sulfite exporter TauE/SafE family protein [Acidobacteriota bacterium]